MAALEKIRKHGILLLIVVGAALVFFIVGDFISSGSSFFQESSANVAVINGDKMKIRKYAEDIEHLNDVIRLEYGSQNVNEEMSNQIRQMVWQSTVNEKVIGDECEKAGMMITSAELADMLVGNNISPLLQNNRMFMNENGQFDPQLVKQFLSTIDTEDATAQMGYEQIRLFRNYWKYWEHSVKFNRLQEKYTNLVTKAMVINPLEAKYSFESNKVSADAVYAIKNYFTLPDSTITVSDAEVKALYKKNKEQYKQKQSAELQYIAVEIRPSQDDFNEVSTWINTLKDEFSTTADIASVTNSNSDVTYRAENLVKDQIDEDFQEFVFNGNADDVMGPILIGDTYKMARIIENKITAPDSVKLSHIYLRAETAEKVQALADSIKTELKNGALFADLAAKHSIAQTAKNGGEIGWLSEMGLDTKIATPAFSTKAGETFEVKEGNDINLFIVNEVGKIVEKAKVAILARTVVASSRTNSILYNAAKEYIVNNNTLETFSANAQEKGYTVAVASNLDINANTLNNLKSAREVIRWAFENKEGEVSDVFEVDNHIVMAAVSKRYEEGYRTIDEMRSTLMAEIRKEKKGEILVQEMQGKTMEQLIAMGYRTDTVRNINFGSTYAGSIGNEPLLFASIATAKANTLSKPFAGNSGAFVYTLISIEDNPATFNEKEEINMLAARESYMTQYLTVEALKEAAKIKDLRYKYY